MFCSISGNVPEDPVINKSTGQLYERRLVEKYVQENGKDPISGQPLDLDDLVSIKTSKTVKPRPSPATSIPGILGLFHNEWDALMLETHQLRQAYNTTRQELSHALYQHDAAIRVIARLKRERDEARAAAETAQKALPAAAGPELANGKRAPEEDLAVEGPAKRAKAGITDEIIKAMTDCNQQLSKGRKKRAVAPGLAAAEDIEAFTLLGSHPLHKTTQPGISAIDVSPTDDNVLASAGNDATVQLFDRAASRIVGSLTGHAKRVTDVKFGASQEVVVSTSADKTARIWRAEGDGYKAAAVLSDHSAEVTAVTLHPTKDYFVTASLDKTWCFYDMQSALCLTQIADESVEGGYTCASFHPDGLILGTGTEESLVRIWEVRQQKNVAKFEGHKGPVTSISFSENGYFLATSAQDGVKLWDLRKLKNFKTLAPYESDPATCVSFDASGLYLAVGGADARVYGVKQDWATIKTFADLPKKGVHAVRWGTDARSLYVGAADHNLRIYGLPADTA
ncbi:hypothetical protein WJX72_000013 [[Myrmecia] bisecta]|uniref:Pre-mRNA-processing factor 19 n=1 Tax=[Myrmecia] bisecta TaxID=41462 RepID=A0AAW1P359_9CHLO